MAANPLKIFLFLLGGSVAGGATAFVSGALDPYIYGKGAGAASVANIPAEAPADPAAPKDERLPGAGEETPPGDTMAAAPPPPDTMAAQPPVDAAATPPAGPQPPTFDVLRVEPDGSVVVAGKALPDSLVELLHGEAIIGKSQSTAEGDFVIVLDEPLKPGDYQLTLRATPASGTAVASVETATLSIPETAGGQVLAMVEQPGQPAELLTVPQPEAPADQPKADEAAAPPAEEKPAEVASAPAETTPPAPEDKPAEAAAAPAETTPPAEDQPKTEEAAAAPAEEKPADVASAPAEAAPPAADQPKTEEAAAAPAEDKPAETTPAPAEAKVGVEAVEIEGNKVFVAGVGDPGRYVRVYANEIVLGESLVSPAGRFLVEAVRELPVGQYMIRADLLDKDGATVLARAIVPFEREEGEAIAAVAPEIAQPAEPKTEEATPPGEEKPAEVAAAPVETTPPAEAAPETEEAAAPPAEEKPADVASAPAETTPPAAPKTEEAAAPPAEEKPAEVAAAPVETTPPAENAPKTEEAAAPPTEEKPAEVAAAPAETAPPAEAAPKTEEAAAPPAEEKPAEVAAAPAETTPPAEAAPKTEEVVAPPAEDKPADVATAPAETTPPDEAAPPETVAPKLQTAKGSVIIRRGDTLWRISRRVYGAGTRFSTIYLANQKQIADPHWIWPGQVFSVPDKSDDGQAADMSAMGNQMIMTPEEAKAQSAAKAQ
jgi:nucleoid-associated protein YgaU